METICIFEGNSYQETLSVKNILEENNIYTIMPNEHISNIVPHYSIATGGFTLLVSKVQFFIAAELLNSLNIKIKNEELVSNLEQIKREKDLIECPNCGNETLEVQISQRTGVIFALFLFFGIPINVKKVTKTCHVCGMISK